MLSVWDKIHICRGQKALHLSDIEGKDAFEAAKKAFGNFCPEDESDIDEQTSDASSNNDMDDGKKGKGILVY